MDSVKNCNGVANASVFSGMLRPAVVSAAFFMVVTGIVYPLATMIVAQALFPGQAHGSLIERDHRLLGSRLIGQYFTRPRYFHSRPSATTGTDPRDPAKTVDQPYNAASSGAGNQGVLSRALLDAVAARAKRYREENGLAPDAKVPADAVTASASGLDPDISLENARLQAPRVATARGLPLRAVLAQIGRHTTGRQFGALGVPRVNVLELNLALDEAVPPRPAAR